MSVLYVANIEYNKYSGIYKKIELHVEILSTLKKECILICKDKNRILTLKYKNGICISRNVDKNLMYSITNLNKKAKQEIEKEQFQIIYYRNTLKPSIYQLQLFKLARKKQIKIIYELPTYPYFKEQLSVAKNKFFTLSKLIVDSCYFPFLYKYSDTIPVIISSSNKKVLKKMFLITNGISEKEIIQRDVKKNENSKIVLVGVGTLYPYHGYSRILSAISTSKKDNFEFWIVGDGPEIQNLKQLSHQLNISDKIKFFGRKNREELQELLKEIDIGVGALALYKRGADIDTTIKLIDYLTRGIPAISSDQKGASLSNKLIYRVTNDETQIDLEAIEKWYMKFDNNFIQQEQIKNKNKYSWYSILESILDEIEEI